MPLNIPDELKLFYVQDSDDDGDDRSLNVQAHDHLEAAGLWVHYYYEGEEWAAAELQVEVQELNLSDKPGPVAWNGENKVLVTFDDDGNPCPPVLPLNPAPAPAP